MLGEDVILRGFAGNEEVGERFPDRVGNVGEGELLLVAGAGDGDFRDGVAFGRGEDLAPSEGTSGGGAVGDGFFEGLVFVEG